MEFGLEMGRGIGIRACVCLGIGFRMRFHEMFKKREVLISLRKRFSQKRMFYCIKTTNRPDQNDRKKRKNISCFHQKVSKTIVFTRETCVFHENHDFQFSL